jgi:hypothetical protein
VCSDLPQGHAFAEQVPQLISGLPAHLKLDAARLDGTEASLDAVDKALRRMSHQRMLNPQVWAALTAYVGEVIRKATNGRWEMRRASDSEKTWEPWIVAPSGRSYAPFKIYKELLEYGRSASLRVFVQWELARGSQQQGPPIIIPNLSSKKLVCARIAALLRQIQKCTQAHLKTVSCRGHAFPAKGLL